MVIELNLTGNYGYWFWLQFFHFSKWHSVLLVGWPKFVGTDTYLKFVMKLSILLCCRVLDLFFFAVCLLVPMITTSCSFQFLQLQVCQVTSDNNRTVTEKISIN